VTVPGHWQANAAFAHADGPLFYRHRFEAGGVAPAAGRRSWLQFDGIFYQGDVWLDGSYLGDTEGYFFPHTFEVTDPVAARRQHVLAVEVACTPPDDRTAKRNLTGIFQHWDCIDPAWNPGGIWAPVRLLETGPVRISSLRVACRDARSEQASLDLDVDLDAAAAATATITTMLRRHPDGPEIVRHQADEALAAGRNRARWRVTVDNPALWWPHALGDQPLYRVDVDVAIPAPSGQADGPGDLVSSDHRQVVTGLRQVRMRDFVATVNGERIFLKGANYGPTRRGLADVTAEALEADVALARQAGLDLLRVHAHVGHPGLYDVTDRQGLLVWKDLPLQWGYARVRRQAVRQARHAVATLGHHPSVAIWCAHNEPLALDVSPGSTVSRSDAGRFVAAQMLPTWNKTALDRSIKRAL
ncbi:MAG: glycosyl hydrolase 2 galactose-binding domain-containing protein, partial [Acidimicrobiales bacterium]